MGVDSVAKQIKDANKNIKINALVDSGFFAEYSSGFVEFDNTEKSSREWMKRNGAFDPVVIKIMCY